MKAQAIREAFSRAGMPVPELIERKLGDDYDQIESWCCGLEAYGDTDGVLVLSYCHRGRGSEKKPCWFFYADGSWEERLGLPKNGGIWSSDPDDYDDDPESGYGEDDSA